MAAERDPIEVAARSLRHRDRSRRDVDARLARAGVDERVREATLGRLEQIGYLDDGRFAHARAASLADRGYGDAAIGADLAQQGIDGELAAEALAGLEPEPVRAEVLLARLGRSARTAARLARKGFALETLEQLRALEPGEDDLRVV